MSRLTQHLIAAFAAPLAALSIAAQQPTAPPPAPPAAAPAPAPAPAESTHMAAPAKPAATAPQPSELQRRVMAYLLKGITLTPDQKEKLDALAVKHREMRLAFGAPTVDSAAMAARVKVVREQMAESRAVLTEEQQKVFDRNLAELREVLTP